MAVRDGLPELAEFLLSEGADASIMDVGYCSPLQYFRILKSEGKHNAEINLQMCEAFEYDRLVKKYPEEEVITFVTDRGGRSPRVMWTVKQLHCVGVRLFEYQESFRRLYWIHTHSTNVSMMQLSLLTISASI